MRIGPHEVPGRVFAAPMAGIADLPLRRLWRVLGAEYCVGEMTTADPRLRGSAKTARRLTTDGTTGPIAVQLAGADPAMLAEAARYCADLGAQIIDINMGCPAKKVCNAASGSALLRDEALVARIIESVVAASTESSLLGMSVQSLARAHRLPPKRLHTPIPGHRSLVRNSCAAAPIRPSFSLSRAKICCTRQT